MSDRVKLRGMTWSHPRGYDPLVACSRIWLEKTGVQVTWEKRSLQDFESYPLMELARQYDLIVIDHPHVGQVTAEGCLEPLDGPSRAEERGELAASSVGLSFPSYEWEGRQWALPIDAASQVQAWRPDLIEHAPTRRSEVVALGREGRVSVPLRSPHTLMCFFTIAANLGKPCETDPESGRLIDDDTGAAVYDLIRELADFSGPKCFDQDPIGALEELAGAASRVACLPLTYGYVSYSVPGFRERRVGFADIPAVGELGPVGGTLGGTGIAVSAFSRNREAAIDFAYWVASGEVQRGPYAAAGGQPGHAAAWSDDKVNAATGSFYSSTRATLEGAWLRPRFNGYMRFQELASNYLINAIQQKLSARTVTDTLNGMFVQSRA